jgi:hypothetical protein
MSTQRSVTIQSHQFTEIIERQNDSYVALCPELDIADQGSLSGEARAHLGDALARLFETADLTAVNKRLHSEVFVWRGFVS